MSRKIQIQKYKDNTHYSVYVIDGYGTEHHLGYWSELDNSVILVIEAKARVIWDNEVKPEEDLLENAIVDCKEIDSKNNNLREI